MGIRERSRRTRGTQVTAAPILYFWFLVSYSLGFKKSEWAVAHSHAGKVYATYIMPPITDFLMSKMTR